MKKKFNIFACIESYWSHSSIGTQLFLVHFFVVFLTQFWSVKLLIHKPTSYHSNDGPSEWETEKLVKVTHQLGKSGSTYKKHNGLSSFSLPAHSLSCHYPVPSYHVALWGLKPVCGHERQARGRDHSGLFGWLLYTHRPCGQLGLVCICLSLSSNLLLPLSLTDLGSQPLWSFQWNFSCTLMWWKRFIWSFMWTFRWKLLSCEGSCEASDELFFTWRFAWRFIWMFQKFNLITIRFPPKACNHLESAINWL